jgi:hypothetical protein
MAEGKQLGDGSSSVIPSAVSQPSSSSGGNTCMTVLNIKAARAIWLVDVRDLNPRGIDLWPMLMALKDRYSFQTYPKTMEEANENDQKGIVFMNGSFAVGSTHHTIAKATIYGDGLVVDSGLSTDFSEHFLSDTLTFLSSQFGLTYGPEMIHTKIYFSELIVRTAKDMSRLFAPIEAVREHLNSITGLQFEPTGFGFGIDLQASTAKPSPFRFEREINKHFSQQRYYSCAPLRTSQHEELLQQLESLL